MIPSITNESLTYLDREKALLSNESSNITSIFQAFEKLSFAYISNFKIRLFEKDRFIQETMDQVKKDNDSKSGFLKALKSQNFDLIQQDLKNYFQKLSAKDQNFVLQIVATEELNSKHSNLTERCLHLLDNDQMIELLKINHENATEIIQYARETLQKIQIIDTFNPYDKTSLKIKHEIQLLIPKILNVLTYYLNLLISSLESFVQQKAPKSAWDVAHQLDVYYKIISLPIAIFSIIQTFFPNPIVSKLTTFLALTSLAGFIYSYRKWLEPIPETIPYGQNISKKFETQENNLFVFGRELQYFELTKQLATNLESSCREHCLIYGPPGVGKTTFINGLSEFLSHQEIYPELKHVSVHRIHATDLLNKAPSYDNKTVYDEIVEAIGRHKNQMILIIDDIHLLLKNSKERGHLLPLLETTSSKKSLPLVIGVSPIDPETDESTKDFYQKEGYQRRFGKKIILDLLDNETTKAIMKANLERRKPHLKIDHKDFDLILKNSTPNSLQPGNGLRLLNQLIQTMEDELKGSKLQEELTKINQQLALEKQNIYQLRKGNLSRIETLEKQKGHLQETLNIRRTHIQRYMETKEFIRQEEYSLKKISENILKNPNVKNIKTKNLITKLIAEKLYILPKRNELNENFALSKDLHFSVTPELIKNTLGSKKNESKKKHP